LFPLFVEQQFQRICEVDIELLFQAIRRIEDRVLTAISRDGIGLDP
jgi:hypothetical protein